MYKLDSIFHSPGYLRITQRRLEHLASLDLPIRNKRVVDVGAGIGDFTSFYLDRGCSVLAVEPRADNIEHFNINLEQSGAGARGNYKTLQQDFWAIEELTESFDIVHAYGVLYHLDSPIRALKALRRRCNGVLLLETCVSNVEGETENVVAEPRENASQAIDGLGCRPNRGWIYNELSGLFPHVYMPLTQPNHEQFPIDWRANYTAESLQRSIFIASDSAIQNPNLCEKLIEKHDVGR